MRILGIDTATSTASVALIDNTEVIAEQISDPQNAHSKNTISGAKSNHAETILPLIESLLQEAEWNLGDISGFAISIGPGSFTGLRIGLSTIKGLAYGSSIPVVGISTLLANAARVTDHEGLICSCLNARKNQVYASLFRKNGDGLHRLSEDSVAPAIAIVETVRSLEVVEPCLFLGDGAIAYGDVISGLLRTRARLSGGESYPSVASAVARLSIGGFTSADRTAIGRLVPRYLRAPECEMKVRSEA